MSSQNIQDTCNSEDINETVVKVENNLDEHIQIKCESFDEDEMQSYENVQIKQEFEPNENITQEINCEMPTDKETIIHRFSTENCNSKVNEITNIYDDNIEIKYEIDQNGCDEDIDSNHAEALHNVEACLQDEIKIKLENETHEENIQGNEEAEHVVVKDEIESETTDTETHLISNEIGIPIATTAQPANTLFMEILPMNIYPGVPLGKVVNTEEILSTPYDAMDCGDSFLLNSITSNMMTLEQEAYGLLEAKKIDRSYDCSLCPKSYKHPKCLKKHQKWHMTRAKCELYKANRLKMRKENQKKQKEVMNVVKVEPKIDVNKGGYECTCGKIFQRKTRLEGCLRSHNATKDPNYLYCGTCYKQIPNKEELLLHRKQMHRKVMFPCKFCPTDYKNRKELFKHLQLHQKVQVMEYKMLSEVVKGKQKLKCFMCEKICPELSELKTHVMYDHKEPYTCPHCNETFSKIIDFGNHMKTEHPEVEEQYVLDVFEAFSKLIKAWKCEDCDVQFHEADKLALHKIEKHSVDLKVQPQFQCIDCRRVYITLKGLMAHRRIHHITDNMEDSGMHEKGVLCIECRKVCRDMEALTSHMRLHSPNRKYKCKFCDFRFATIQKRKAHAGLHTGDMKYVCFICEYQCSSLNRLQQHKRSVKHLSMKDYLSTGKVLGVEQSTSKTDDLEKQEWMVVKGDENDDSGDDSSNAGGEVTCDICGLIFNSMSKMLEHQKSHPFIEIPNDDKPTRIFFK